MLILTSDQFVRSYLNYKELNVMSVEPVFENGTGLSVYRVIVEYGGRMNVEYVSLDRNAVCDYTDTAVAWVFWRERLHGPGGTYPWYDELLGMSDSDFEKNVLDRCWRMT